MIQSWNFFPPTWPASGLEVCSGKVDIGGFLSCSAFFPSLLLVLTFKGSDNGFREESQLGEGWDVFSWHRCPHDQLGSLGRFLGDPPPGASTTLVPLMLRWGLPSPHAQLTLWRTLGRLLLRQRHGAWVSSWGTSTFAVSGNSLLPVPHFKLSWQVEIAQPHHLTFSCYFSGLSQILMSGPSNPGDWNPILVQEIGIQSWSCPWSGSLGAFPA